MEIHDGGQVHPATLSWDIGDVGDPDLIKSGGPTEALEAVGSAGASVTAVGGPGPEWTFRPGLEVMLPHKTSDPVFAAAEVLALEATRDAGTAISLVALVKNPFKV